MTRWLCGLIAVLVAAPSLFADEALSLRWRFEKGRTLAYLLKHREVRTTQAGDQKLETTTNSEYEWQWKVQDVDEHGVATLEQKFTALRVTCTGMNFEFSYDSARANNYDEDYKKKLGSLLDQLRYGTYRLKLKPDGRLADVQGFDKLLAEVGEEGHVADFHSLNLHDASFGWFLQQALGVLPEKPAAKGDKWKLPVQSKWQGLGEMTGQSDFTLGPAVDAGGKPCRQIDIAGTYSLDVDMKWLGNTLKGTLKTDKLSGKVCFDPKAGRVQHGEADVVVGGEVKLGANDQPGRLKMALVHRLELEAK